MSDGKNVRVELADRAAPEAGGVRSIGRAIQILSLLSDANAELTLRETVAATGLPKTTAKRLLSTLEQYGLLWAAGNGTYCAGPALLRWASLGDAAWRLPPSMQAILAETAERCNESVKVYIRINTKRVCIAERHGTQSLRHVVRVGDELPMWAGAAAKILLIDAPRLVRRAIALESPGGIAHLETLNEWAADAAQRGWSVSSGEREHGLSAVAVPVQPMVSGAPATLSIAGPTSRFPAERIPEFVQELLRTADRLNRAAGISDEQPERPTIETGGAHR